MDIRDVTSRVRGDWEHFGGAYYNSSTLDSVHRYMLPVNLSVPQGRDSRRARWITRVPFLKI